MSPGLSFRDGPSVSRRPAARSAVSTSEDVALPNRAARVLSGYTFIGRQIDVVETSRGCTYDCSFCSIIEMRGRNFHTWSIERVLADIADARARGARAIFIVDDNITLNVAAFEALCRAIVAAGFNDIDYLVQGMTSSIAAHGETLAPLMREAGFRYVFLGIENVLDEDLAFLRAARRTRSARRAHGRQCHDAAIELLHRHGMFVVGGLIVGNPDDTRESIDANLAFARDYVDWPYIQHPTPYPGTPMTRDFRDRDLIVSDDVDEYDGTTAVVRSEHLDATEIEFMRWRAERWMKLRHFWPVLLHSPVVRPPPRPRDAGAHVPRRVVALAAGTGIRARLCSIDIRKSGGSKEVSLGRHGPQSHVPLTFPLDVLTSSLTPFPAHPLRHAWTQPVTPALRAHRCRASARAGRHARAASAEPRRPYLQGHDEGRRARSCSSIRA